MDRIYAAIDLKSFYASVECVARGLDPLKTNLVVADTSRTEKTICLAVSPGLKAYGISGRARLFEVIEKVKEINAERIRRSPLHRLARKSFYTDQLAKDPSLAVDFVIAAPRMKHYMEVSGKIFQIYINYISPDDIHVYSIDEVFIDLTGYLKTYGLTPRELTMKLIREVLEQTGITATAGIGPNLYLAKIAMDIEAKHCPPDENGVRIAELDEQSYRRKLWNHQPITDFWRVGRGYAKRLAAKGLYTMGDIAKCSVGAAGNYYSEDLLFELFGVNAELLIDHAWGWEPCTIADIKAYNSDNNSISSGQVLKEPYNFEDSKIIIREMADTLALELVKKDLVTDQVILDIGYDTENLSSARQPANYSGEVKTDRYGRKTPKPAHGSVNLERFSSSGHLITEAALQLFDKIADRDLLIRHIYLVFNHVSSPEDIQKSGVPVQPDLFSDLAGDEKQEEEIESILNRENKLQKSILEIQSRYGKNAILKGMNLQEKATQKERNAQIGGHRSGSGDSDNDRYTSI